MTIRQMTLDDLKTVLDWAGDEGWNPGLEDPVAFLTSDPGGFLVKEVQGIPVAAISVVNHDTAYAFLGLYLCKPEYRGQGFGMEVWRAGISHAGARSIGLDGVPEQEANYARSGFVKYGSTTRYEGRIGSAPDLRLRPAQPSDLPALLDWDVSATGITRTAFASTWFSSTATRQTVVIGAGSDLQGFATFRQCASGIKVGPLQATSRADALALLQSNPFAVPGAPVFIDIQDRDPNFALLLEELDFEPGFKTARMFTGAAPENKGPMFQAIATMELG